MHRSNSKSGLCTISKPRTPANYLAGMKCAVYYRKDEKGDDGVGMLKAAGKQIMGFLTALFDWII